MKLEIDLNIADELSIVNIVVDEEREIYFDAEEDWQGTYELKVYNSRAKSESATIADAITTTEKRLTWSLKPSSQGISAGKHYAEITHVEEKTVIFKADITIAE